MTAGKIDRVPLKNDAGENTRYRGDKRMHQKSRTKRRGLAKSEISFQGKKSDVTGFLTYAAELREFLDANLFPDAVVLEAICDRVKEELKGERLVKLCLEQKCSVCIEALLIYLRNQMTNGSVTDEHKKICTGVYVHFIRQLLGHLHMLARGMYSSRVLQKLLELFPYFCDSIDRDVNASWTLVYNELSDTSMESGQFWPLIESANGTHVLRTLLQSSVAGKRPELVLRTAEFVVALCGQAIRTEWLWTKCYESPVASPTIQAMLIALKDQDLGERERIIWESIRKNILPATEEGRLDVKQLIHLASESRVGCRTLEAFIKEGLVDRDTLGHFAVDVVARNIDALVESEFGNYVVQAVLRASQLKPSALQKLIESMDFDKALNNRPGVVWAAADAGMILGHSQTKLVEQILGSRSWSHLLNHGTSEEEGPRHGGHAAVRVSIAQVLVQYPKKYIGHRLRDLAAFLTGEATTVTSHQVRSARSSKTIKEGQKESAGAKPEIQELALEVGQENGPLTGQQHPLLRTTAPVDLGEFTKNNSYFIQTCLRELKGEPFTKLARSLTVISRELVRHPKASFVVTELHAQLGSAVARINGGPEQAELMAVRHDLASTLRSMASELQTVNYALYNKCGLGNVKMPSLAERFQRGPVRVNKKLGNHKKHGSRGGELGQSKSIAGDRSSDRRDGRTSKGPKKLNLRKARRGNRDGPRRSTPS